jgi:hypothetical protein
MMGQVLLGFLAIVIIYTISQLLKRRGKMEKHDAFTALMNAGMMWGAVIVGLYYVIPEAFFLLAVGLFTIVFGSLVGVYFYWNYRKTHKKSQLLDIGLKPSVVPLTPDIVKPTEPVKPSRRKLTFIKNLAFFVLEIIEAIFFLSLIFEWDVVTVPVGEYNVPVLTYQNGIILVFFAIAIILIIRIIQNLRHPQKTFFED